MGLFGPPNVEKLKSKRDIEGLFKALGYRKDYWNENAKFDRSLREDIERVAAVRAAAAQALGEIGDPRGVTALIEALNDKVFEVRNAAVEALAKIGKPAVKSLGAELMTNNWDISRSAARALGMIGDTSAVDYLIAALEDEKCNFIVRDHVITALGLTGDSRAVEPLIHKLKDGGGSASANVARVLGDFNDQRAIEPLRSLLKEKDKAVRKAASEALDKLGWKPDQPGDRTAYWLQKGDVNQCAKLGTKAVDFLIKALKNEDTLETAVDALGKIGDARALEPLVEVLKAEEQEARVAAINALGHIKDTRAIEPILAAVSNEPRLYAQINRRSYLMDADIRRAKPVNQAAVTALIQMGKPAAASLVEFLRENPSFGKLIQEVFCGIGEPSVGPLIAAMKHSNEHFQGSAANILVAIGKPSVQPLSDLLLSKDKRLRLIAASTLDKLKWQPSQDSRGAAYYIVKGKWQAVTDIGAPAVKPLINALKDDDEKIRQRAALSLGEIGELEAAESLIAMEKDREFLVRDEALEALIKINPPQILDILLKALKDKHFRVRYTAVEALGEKKDARALEPLITMLKDKDVLVSRTSAWSLGELGDACAIDPLTNLLKNQNVDSDVKRMAARSLVQLFKSGKLDDPQKQSILGLRSTIVETSKPHWDSHSDWGCTSSHSDSPADIVEFPL